MQYIIKNKNVKNFTQIHNELIHNCKSELDVLGFATVLLSKPSDWVINVYGLMKELGIGKERVLRLLSALEKKGYIYKKRSVQFAKKGEQKVFYYMFDSKEILQENFYQNTLDSDSQLPLKATPPTLLPNMDIPDVRYPHMKESSHTNKDITNTVFNKEIINKKNTKLTLIEALDKVVDEKTKVNILNANPKLTLEEFEAIYKRVVFEHKKNYCKNINAILVLAVAGRWNFRSKLSEDKNQKNGNEFHDKVIKGNYNYYVDYFKEIDCTDGLEISKKFLRDCKKYDPEIVEIYFKKLKKELGIV